MKHTLAAALNERMSDSVDHFNIVYSPLHGAGQTNVLPVLRTQQVLKYFLVEDQMVPDGNFPTS